MNRTFSDYLVLYLKGLCMGVADVIPGVSGGTIAFISGIYDELIDSIRSVDGTVFKLLLKFRIAEVWRKINATFLISVLAGVGTSLISLAHLMTWLLETYPIPVWSFFFGLICISAVFILRENMHWNIGAVTALIIGIIIGAAITILAPTQTPTNLYFIFFCGALAICAMILPGISGAFILLLIGKYYFMIEALTTINLPVILVFVLGCVIGLLSFSHLLSWLLHHYRNLTIALLAGFMLGSLNKVWPWKKSFQVLGEKETTMDVSIWPWNYLPETGSEPQFVTAICFAAAGILLVVLIEKVADKIKTSKSGN